MDWKFVDSVLEKYRQQYSAKQNDLKDELENELIKYGKITDLFGIVSEDDLKRFQRFLGRNEDYIKDNGYCYYKVGKIKPRKRITYKEMLDIIVLVLFAKFQYDIYKDRFDTLSTIGSNVYSSTIKECEKLGHKPTGEIPLLDDLLILYLLMPNEKGTTYQEQNDAQTIYNASQISKQIVIDTMSKLPPDIRGDRYSVMFERFKRQEINKKKDSKQKDKYSGIIDDQSTFVSNQIKLQLLKLYGFKYCEFVGIEDERQTEMCKSLSGQIFSLTELNVYKRYSSLDKEEVEYKTVGMLVGENLPPITNHKHACRSFIMPSEKGETKNESNEYKDFKYQEYTTTQMKQSYLKTKENMKDDEHVQWVDPKKINKFAQHWRSGKYANKTPEEFEKLKKDIAENGLRDGIGILYDASDGYTVINEGNNRLAIMNELNYPKVPVYITRTTENTDRRNGKYLQAGLGDEEEKYMTIEELFKDQK